ncbi:WD repeat-containing protein on Y chromosome [Acropora cervicornis]|uniref:WD repeat-containing protein on Y chromosome n=1 Tax=Acropora cervicornis TaxID=6130 RepID=A0AAD9UTI6_ACRCE|nr:WD repeat-containing protein on Y chromosome [Acropora cervicornis]
MEEKEMRKRVHFPPDEDQEELSDDELCDEKYESQDEIYVEEEEMSVSEESDNSRLSLAKSEEWQGAMAEQHGLKTSRAASKEEEETGKQVMVKLEDQMNNENLEILQKIFEEADEDGGGGLDMDEFRQAMIKTMAGKGEVEEFCSYMLLETQLKDVMTSEDREMEFPNPAREIPSSHRDAITRITYLPKLSHATDDPSDSNGGRYVSVSKEGTLHFWSMDLMHPQKTLSLGHEGKASKNVWITDCVVLPNAKKLALSSADREIAFYDCSANSFDKQLVICSLDYCVLTMNYWYCSTKLNEGILLFGDSGGSVYCLKFFAMAGCLIDLNIGQQIPSDWVRKVKYYPSLQSFISCATASNTSMYLGDVGRKKTGSVFRIRKGISSFDYCKEWNVIVTGGVDHYVRLWNPYVTAKATSTLKGHNSAVTHILVNSDKGEIISAAQDKLSVIEGQREEPSEEQDFSSHFKPICAAIYNDLFEQVVSACHDSVVCVWSLETGEKIIQFSHAHGTSEVTAMRFDPSKRRLITGARDGTVKIWNFNNGCCLSQLKTIDDQEITAILCYKQMIITVGWNRKVAIYRDCREEEESEPRVWPHFHEDDILSAALYPNGLVATCAYDGVVKVWNIETGHVTCRLTTKDYVMERKTSIIPDANSGHPRKDSGCARKDFRFLRNDSCCLQKVSGVPHKDSDFLEPDYEAKRSIEMDIDLPSEMEFEETCHDCSVDKVLFLARRENDVSTATLMTSGSDGTVRAWSVIGGGLLGLFTATQGEHDSVVSLTTDHNNSILATGDTAGFVKVWDISAYCLNPDHQKTPGMPPRKLQLVKRGRTIDSKPPPLLVSFRAHLKSVVSLDFVDSFRLIISGSKDASVRLWTQMGKYVGTYSFAVKSMRCPRQISNTAGNKITLHSHGIV